MAALIDAFVKEPAFALATYINRNSADDLLMTVVTPKGSAKIQWDKRNKNYYYYTKIHNDSILNNTKEELLNAYPYFFVAPFNVLKPELKNQA